MYRKRIKKVNKIPSPDCIFFFMGERYILDNEDIVYK